MAEIPVERKQGVPWWVWLLGALALLGLLGLLTRGCNDGGAAVNTNLNGNTNLAVANLNTNANLGTANSNINVAGVGNASGANVTDINLFGNTADKQSLVGRRVDLQSVRVTRVLSDHLFTVTSGSGEMFAILDENLDTAGGREERIKIRTGQTLNLGGTFQRVPTSGELTQERRTGLTPAETEALRNQQVHLHVTQVSEAR